jgi:hypothetical protein
MNGARQILRGYLPLYHAYAQVNWNLPYCDSDSVMRNMEFMGTPVFGRLFLRTFAWGQTLGVPHTGRLGKWLTWVEDWRSA